MYVLLPVSEKNASMANLNSILAEINRESLDFDTPFDIVRKRYIKKLSKYTNRNTICYYSAFLNCSQHSDTGINDKDMNGFMTAVHKVDKSIGLDLIIHSPGGGVSATEAIGDYLRKVFGNDIRIIVPHMAMSAGTLLSCIGKEIVMGRHSSLGPFDPQLSGVSAYEVLQQIETAKQEIIDNPNTALFWQQFIGKYPPLFLRECTKVIELSEEVARKWLQGGGMTTDNDIINEIINFFNSNEHTKEHARHIDMDRAKAIGLTISALEDDDKLQEYVLSIHHAYTICFQNTNRIKFIENDMGASFVISNDE